MKLLWSVMLLGVLFIRWATCYGFRNCIQQYYNTYSYSCSYRKQWDLKNIISDLPNNTLYLNISHNTIKTLYQGGFNQTPQLRLLNICHNNVLNIDNGAFDNLTKLQYLYLSFNQISNLSVSVFQSLISLKSLYLNNNHLVSINANVFNRLHNLNLLNLSSNFLHNFSQVVLAIQPLKKLTYLNLCFNQLTSLNHSQRLPYALTKLFLCQNQLHDLNCEYNFLSNITYLDLSENDMTSSSLQKVNLSKISYLKVASNYNFSITDFLTNSTVPPDKIDYSGLYLNNSGNISSVCQFLKDKHIYKLTLNSNDIKNLTNDSFNNCGPITHLDLSRNRLKSIKCLDFIKHRTLSSITVEHNLLKILETCSYRMSFLNLSTISLRFNRIWMINRYAFAHTPNLQNLSLNINNIVWIKNNSFKGLSKLTTLRLDNNLIIDLYNTTFNGLTELRTLNLRNNRISVIFNNTFRNLRKLHILDLGGNKITHLEGKALCGLQTLSNLYLDNNNIRKISMSTFRFIENTLQVLDLGANKLQYKSAKKTFSPFSRLRKVYDLKLQAQQPYGLSTLPHRFLAGLPSLRMLYLSQNRLTNLNSDVFDDLDQLIYLDLAEDCNGIQNFPPGIFKNQTKLRVLNLQNICLQTFNAEVFADLIKLEKLNLNKNGLKHIDVRVLNSMTKLKYLDLSYCPLKCICNNEELQMWLNKSEVQIIHLYNMSCPGEPTSYFYNFEIHVCDMKIKTQLFCSTFTAILVFIIIPIVYSKSYWCLKYNYFLFLAWLHERWKSDKERYKYDAFISYNTKDEEWVYSEMLPMLETCNPAQSLRLCLHHRDFQLGRDIIDNIVDSIHNSRKTVCVISRSYLRSEWCFLEMQLASYKLFDEMRDVLVFVLLENIPDRELSTYHRMRKVMLKKTYISWPAEPEAQKLFWAKLIKALKSNSSPTEDENQGFTVNEECLPSIG
ncbi:toll-like receptor 13 [Bombina bombina]|uniref:toll-like receptor 13 n=1 Tax=Bombina bombina TaxID=8345 RepID=UPI00235ADF7A|nr:toll-like receptor 13 [Bombina bombina]